MKDVILASKSPRRKELLKKVINDFNIEGSNVVERVPFYIKKENHSLYLAKLKAKDVYKRNRNAIVIGSDTIVYVDNKILGKPKNYEDARRMMHLLSNKTHQVITGVSIISSDFRISYKEITYVTFIEISDQEIDEYCKIKSIYDKAGAYAIQEDAGKYVSAIKGEYDNVVGLPTIRLKEIFKTLK